MGVVIGVDVDDEMVHTNFRLNVFTGFRSTGVKISIFLMTMVITEWSSLQRHWL